MSLILLSILTFLIEYWILKHLVIYTNTGEYYAEKWDEQNFKLRIWHLIPLLIMNIPGFNFITSAIFIIFIFIKTRESNFYNKGETKYSIKLNSENKIFKFLNKEI